MGNCYNSIFFNTITYDDEMKTLLYSEGKLDKDILSMDENKKISCFNILFSKNIKTLTYKNKLVGYKSPYNRYNCIMFTRKLDFNDLSSNYNIYVMMYDGVYYIYLSKKLDGNFIRIRNNNGKIFYFHENIINLHHKGISRECILTRT
jgi:hypothetical protein